MKFFVRCALGLLLAGSATLAPSSALSSGPVRFWEDYEKQIKTRSAITALGPDLFGDEVDLYTSSLSFRHTDITLPGNDSLPVTVTRVLSVANKAHEMRDRPFADWDLDVPRLSGVFSTDWPELRCSQAYKPPTVIKFASSGGVGSPWGPSTHSISFDAADYWQGNQAHMPGGGEMLLVTSATPRPSSGGPYHWVTSSHVVFSCLSSIQNGAGEGFLAVAPDGTKYRFDWMARYFEPETEKSRLLVPSSAENETTDWVSVSAQISRKRNVLYATRVEDRFGNWVEYKYSNSTSQPARLEYIHAKDGRRIDFFYNASGRISEASDGTRSWSYGYTNGSLSEVLLPDKHSKWVIDFNPLSSAEIDYDGDLPQKQCGALIVFIGGGGVGRITHPSGAVGEFEVAPVRQGRTNVPKICQNYTEPKNHPGDDVAVFTRQYVLLGLKRKKITGPGLDPMEWLYSSGSPGSWIEGSEPQCASDDCAGASSTIVTGPGVEWVRYTFGTSFRYNEGKLLRVYRGTDADHILRKEVMAYELAQSGQPFPTPIGTSPQSRGDGFTSEYLRPMVARVITQQDTDFIWIVDKNCTGADIYCFNEFAQPTQVLRTSMATGTTELIAPTGTPSLTLDATTTSGSYSVKWTPVAYASRYELRERLDAGAWSTIHNAGGESVDLSGRANGSWDYQILACNPQGCGAWSALKSIVVMVPPSEVPVVTAPPTNTNGNYSVEWTTVPRATDYELDERKDGGDWVTVYDSKGTNSKETSKSFGFKWGGSYQYRARAKNEGGYSGYSTIVTTDVTVTLPPPPAPATLTAPATAETMIPFTVSWSSVSGATYRLQRNRNNLGWSTTYEGGEPSASQNLGMPGSYQYRAQACNSSGCGADSPTTTVVVSGGQ